MTGTEGYQVLVAPVGEQWQARIVTVPDTPWTIPGRAFSAKFLDDNPDEVQRLAVLHIFKVCRAANIEIVELGIRQAHVSDDVTTGRRMGGKRFRHRLTALFGINRPTTPALILDMSVTGLGLRTEFPEPVGKRIRVTIQIDQLRIPLTGVVVWSRRRTTSDLPVGMGIELEESPFAYRQFLASLDTGEAEED